MDLDIYFLVFICLILVIIAVFDLLFHKVYNILTVPTMIISITYLGITQGLNGILYSLGGIGLGMGILIIPYVFGLTAAGDVKLMGAVGAALGPAGAIISYLYSAIFGGVYALLIILYKKKRVVFTNFGSTLMNFVLTRSFVPEIPTQTEVKKMKMCYGLPIAMGTILYIALEISGYQLINF